MKKLTTILMLIGMALSIGTVQGQAPTVNFLDRCSDSNGGITFVVDSTYGNMVIVGVLMGDSITVNGTVMFPVQPGTVQLYEGDIVYIESQFVGPELLLFSSGVTFDQYTYPLGATTSSDVSITCGETYLNSVISSDTAITLVGANVFGCDSVIYITTTPYKPSICVVTDDDNNGHNEIVFDIAGGADYNIYRGNDLIYTRMSSDNTYFEDDGSLNSEFAYSYSIEAIEVGCGVSTLSDVHTAIKLTTSTSSDTVVNLSWNSYQGIDFQNAAYVIERTRGIVTDSIFGVSTDLYLTNTPITKSGHESGDVYQVVVNLQVQCSAQRDNPSIRSNRSNPNSVGINDIDETMNLTIVNPSEGLHLTSTKTVDVDVFDLNGRLLRTYNQVSQLNDDTYTNGMYLVVIKDDTNWIAKKLIID